jgi:hypothetical protein
MTNNSAASSVDRRALFSGMAVSALGGVLTSAAQAQTRAASGGFSFVACGDSRPMMYLPYQDGHPDLVRLFVEMFGLVMPERVAEEVVKRDVKMVFDPVTKDLVQVIMPFMTRSEVMTLSVDQGWVTRATVEDVKLLPGVHREMFQLQGGDWVAREIVGHVQAGRAKFVINSGDVVWWGNQGHLISDSPYWKRVSDTMLKLLPPPDDELRAAGLDGRWFLAVGNHEVWGDPKIEGTLAAVPYLKNFGVTPERLIYKFDFKDVRFVFLWTGKYDYRSPSLWDGDRPIYAEQMTQLRQWLDEAKAKGMKKAFIVFHYPVFCRAGLGPIPEADNPHKVIAAHFLFALPSDDVRQRFVRDRLADALRSEERIEGCSPMWVLSLAHASISFQGSITVRPQPAKPSISRVTTLAPRARATDAIMRSMVAAGRPTDRRAANSSA